MFFRCFFCTVRLLIFERFVFPKGSKFNRLVWDSLEIWKCGLYKFVKCKTLFAFYYGSEAYVKPTEMAIATTNLFTV